MRAPEIMVPWRGGSAHNVAATYGSAWQAKHPWIYLTWLFLRWLARHPVRLATGILGLYVAAKTSPAFGLADVIALALAWRALRTARVVRQSSALTTLAAIVPALANRRRVLRRWPMAASAAGLEGPSGVAPLADVLLAAERDVTAVVFPGAAGKTAAKVEKNADTLAAVIGCRVVAVREVTPGLATLSFRWGDPLARTVRLVDLPPLEPATPGKEKVAYGVNESEQPATLWLKTSVLVAGESGAGKSNLVWAALAGFVEQKIPVRLRVIDPAGGVELKPLANAGRWVWTVKANPDTEKAGLETVLYHGVRRAIVCRAVPGGPVPVGIKNDSTALRSCEPCLRGELPMFHVHTYVDRPADAPGVVKGAVASMFTRMGQMVDNPHRATVREPHDLTIVDEMLLLGALLKEGATGDMGTFLAVGRKASHTMLGCTQLGQKQTLGDIRDLFPQRIALSMGSRAMTDAVLGDGATAEGARAHKIPDSTPGVGYAFQDGVRGYAKFRAALIEDDEKERIAHGLPVIPTDQNATGWTYEDEDAPAGWVPDASPGSALDPWGDDTDDVLEGELID